MTQRVLYKEDFANVIAGATLLGSGGGGSPKGGMDLMASALTEPSKGVRLVSADSAPDTDMVVMVAGIGSPVAFLKKGFDVEAVYAFDAMERLYMMAGQRASFLVPGEIGGFNLVTPMYVAVKKDVPVIDADGNGRAVPELETSLWPLYGIPNSPCVLADKKGNVVVLYTRDPLDSATCELVARYVATAFENTCAFATWTMNVKSLREVSVLNSVTRCENIGKAINGAVSAGKDPVNAAIEASSGYELIRGIITDITTKTVTGFDFGTTAIEGTDKYKGKKMKIDFKNENMLAWKEEGEAAAMVPDLICLMTTKGEPLTNADTKTGMEIAVIGIPAPEKWRKHPRGFEVWRHIIEKIGYTESYKPIEKLV
ncbi:MAG: DUF917 domain-containing protein [Candidatus Bathyarchaeia archaeon]|jgi:DUF917 family protein